MNGLEVLQQAKNFWDLSHAVGGATIKNESGKRYVLLQGTTGSSIIDIASGDTWDDLLVGFAGNIAQAFLLAPLGVTGLFIESSWIISKASGISETASLGDVLKDYYKYIKRDIKEQK